MPQTLSDANRHRLERHLDSAGSSRSPPKPPYHNIAMPPHLMPKASPPYKVELTITDPVPSLSLPLQLRINLVPKRGREDEAAAEGVLPAPADPSARRVRTRRSGSPTACVALAESMFRSIGIDSASGSSAAVEAAVEALSLGSPSGGPGQPGVFAIGAAPAPRAPRLRPRPSRIVSTHAAPGAPQRLLLRVASPPSPTCRGQQLERDGSRQTRSRGDGSVG